MNRRCVFAVLCCLSLARVSQAAEDSAANAFSQLKSLVGDWNGTYEWTGARTGAGPISAIYRVTGSGSALVEDLIMEGTPVMMSVYHLDGANLRITHFCGAQNQPRLKAERIDLAHGVIDFGFIDITNLRAADAGRLLRHQRSLAPLRLPARARPARDRPRLPEPRRRPARPSAQRSLPRGG